MPPLCPGRRQSRPGSQFVAPGRRSTEAGLVQTLRRQNPLQLDGADGSNLCKPLGFLPALLALSVERDQFVGYERAARYGQTKRPRSSAEALGQTANDEAERLRKHRTKGKQIALTLDLMRGDETPTLRRAAQRIHELGGEIKPDSYGGIVVTLPATLTLGDGPSPLRHQSCTSTTPTRHRRSQ